MLSTSAHYFVGKFVLDEMENEEWDVESREGSVFN